MKDPSGKELIDLYELVDFELFNLTATGVIPRSPDGIPLKAPRYALPDWRLDELREIYRILHTAQGLFPAHCDTKIPPETWAAVERGRGWPLLKSELLTALKVASFPFEQLPPHYRWAFIGRDIESQQSKETEVEEVIMLALPEVKKLYALTTSKEQMPKGIKNTDNLPAVFKEKVFVQWKGNSWFHITKESLNIYYTFTPGQEARDFKTRVLQRILWEHGFIVTVTKILATIQART